MRPNFFHHLHPPTIPAAQARWRHTLGAGGLAVLSRWPFAGEVIPSDVPGSLAMGLRDDRD